MSTLLKHAGAPSSALKLLPEIVDTCKICRMWKRPTPKSITNTRLAEKFNEAVQWDILFYKKSMISHLLDEAIRWSTASLLTSKDAPSLITAISQDWVRPFGGPRVLIADGEKGLCSEQVAQFLDRCNTQLKSKAPGEHAQMVERHHELLRQTLHKLEEQLIEEGIAVPFSVVLNEAVLAKNSLTSVGGHTPYRALYGRDPPVLVEFEPTSETQLDDTSGGIPGHSRHHLRIREIATQSMLQASAQTRLQRALTSKTRVAAEQLELSPGDLVDWYRPPSTKDESGWRGPAVVVNSDSVPLTIKWQSQHINVRVQDLRRSLVHMVFFADAFVAPGYEDPRSVLVVAAEALGDGKTLRVGWLSNMGRKETGKADSAIGRRQNSPATIEQWP